MKKAVLFSAMALTMLCACKKSKKDVTPAPVTVTTVPDNQPGNPANTIDTVGSWHNKLLGELVTATNGDTSLVDITNNVALLTQVHFGQKLPGNFYANVYTAVHAGNYGNLIAQAPVSSTAKEYLNDLLKIFPQKVSDGPAVPDYPTLKKQVVALEKQIQQEATLSDAEKTGLLSVCSVARYSAYYWTNQPQIAGSILKFIATVTGDIGGAIEGFVSGNDLTDVISTSAECSDYWYQTLSWMNF